VADGKRAMFSIWNHCWQLALHPAPHRAVRGQNSNPFVVCVRAVLNCGCFARVSSATCANTTLCNLCKHNFVQPVQTQLCASVRFDRRLERIHCLRSPHVALHPHFSQNTLATIVLTAATVSNKQKLNELSNKQKLNELANKQKLNERTNERNKMGIVQAGCNYINKMLKVLGSEAAVTSATMAAVLTALRDLELALPSESTMC
jgi:TPP-dependent indolepyruvate ferredoxin oxidoreductase alpha subunit